MGNYLKVVHGKAPLHVWVMPSSERPGHEWIEVDGIVLDITLDQFDDRFSEYDLPSYHAGSKLPFHQDLLVDKKTEPPVLDNYVDKWDSADKLAIMNLYDEITSYVHREITV